MLFFFFLSDLYRFLLFGCLSGIWFGLCSFFLKDLLWYKLLEPFLNLFELKSLLSTGVLDLVTLQLFIIAMLSLVVTLFVCILLVFIWFIPSLFTSEVKGKLSYLLVFVLYTVSMTIFFYKAFPTFLQFCFVELGSYSTNIFFLNFDIRVQEFVVIYVNIFLFLFIGILTIMLFSVTEMSFNSIRLAVFIIIIISVIVVVPAELLLHMTIYIISFLIVEFIIISKIIYLEIFGKVA